MTSHILNCLIALYKGIQISESGKCLLGEFGIRKILAGKITNPRLWNPEYSERNLESHDRLESGVQVLRQIQYLISGIYGVESISQDCLGLPYLRRIAC